MKRLLLILVVILLAGAAYWMTRPSPFDTDAPLLADGRPIALLEGLDTNTLPDGWTRQTFFRIPPTRYQVTEQDGRLALRCTTDASGSILARDTRIAVADLPMLSWRWKVVQPIVSDIDEATSEGDDHPLRLFLQFANQDGEPRATEIIWSNRKFLPGGFKIIGSFYHYVANGLDENTGKWHQQRIDLRNLYRDIGGTGTPTLETLGFFCDSDNTGARSDGYFSDVLLSPDQ